MRFAFALLLAIGSIASARDFVSVNDQARFLAGLPVAADSPLARFTATAAWQQHALEMDAAWAKCEQMSLSKARAWSSKFVKSSSSSEPCYYMFSGPDILYARMIFPNASRYVLCGIEPVGNVPDISQASGANADAALGAIRRSLSNVLRFSYFITKDMKVDLGGSNLTGTLPILYFFLARMGCDITSVEYVSLASSGVLGKGGVPGVKITFRGGRGSQTCYYFRGDLSNGGSGTAVMNFCRKMGPNGLGLLKAASYLLHEGSFSSCREFLLQNCRVLVQDDSGIPLRHFDPQRWQLRYFGTYAGTTGGPFAKYYQSELANAYANANAAPIDFQISYQWNPKLANLLVAVRSGANAVPVRTAVAVPAKKPVSKTGGAKKRRPKNP